MMISIGIRGGMAVALATVLALTSAGSASGSRDQRGGVSVTTSAQLLPRELPRQGRAPVAVRLGADFGAVSGGSLPRLRSMTFAINREGRLDHRGIPRCGRAQLESTTIDSALAGCRRALVGHGAALIRVEIPGHRSLVLGSRALLFNAPGPRGRPRLILYMSSHMPFSPFLVDVSVRRGSGVYGTRLTAVIPPETVSVNVLRFELALRRRHLHRGSVRSYLSAGCPAPRGLPGLLFPFVRSTFEFEGGIRLSTESMQACRVQGSGS